MSRLMSKHMSKHIELQVVSALACVAVYTVLLFWAAPYVEDEEDLLEGLLSGIIFLVIVGGRLRGTPGPLESVTDDIGEASIYLAVGIGVFALGWSVRWAIARIAQHRWMTWFRRSTQVLVDLSKHFVHLRILKYSRDAAMSEFDKGVRLETLLKFLWASDSKQRRLYKKLRGQILRGKSRFKPHELWNGINAMVPPPTVRSRQRLH